MAAVFCSNQPDVRIRCESRMRVNLERNQRIVFSCNNQCRDLNCVEVSSRRLRRVIVRSGSEAEERSGKSIVELPNGSYVIQAVGAVEVWPELALSPDAASQAIEESSRIQAIGRPIHGANAGGEIDGCRYGANTCEQLRTPEFTGQLERDIAAQREADQENGTRAAPAQCFQDKLGIAG